MALGTKEIPRVHNYKFQYFCMVNAVEWLIIFTSPWKKIEQLVSTCKINMEQKKTVDSESTH